MCNNAGYDIFNNEKELSDFLMRYLNWWESSECYENLETRDWFLPSQVE